MPKLASDALGSINHQIQFVERCYELRRLNIISDAELQAAIREARTRLGLPRQAAPVREPGGTDATITD